jgi:hypothetical protein
LKEFIHTFVVVTGPVVAGEVVVRDLLVVGTVVGSGGKVVVSGAETVIVMSVALVVSDAAEVVDVADVSVVDELVGEVAPPHEETSLSSSVT